MCAEKLRLQCEGVGLGLVCFAWGGKKGWSLKNAAGAAPVGMFLVPASLPSLPHAGMCSPAVPSQLCCLRSLWDVGTAGIAGALSPVPKHPKSRSRGSSSRVCRMFSSAGVGCLGETCSNHHHFDSQQKKGAD